MIRWIVLVMLFLATSALAQQRSMNDPAQQRLTAEACALVAQQRNSLSDAIAIAEANRKIEGEDTTKVKQRVAEWEAYFRAYIGAAKE